jgi:ADP-heptose:LPS heptosyltransferase
MHAVDRYWLVIHALGIDHQPKRFRLPIDANDRLWAATHLQPRPRPWIMLNLGTRWETKRWPVASFATLAGRALQAYGGTIVLVGGPEEQNLARRFEEVHAGPLLDLTGQTNLKQLAAVLAQADVMVSNDSGPLHLAAALGRPVLAPYTCTSPLRTGPYQCPDGAVATEVWCAASYRKHCRRMDCMRELTPDRLWPALEALLSRWQKHSA